MDRNIRCHLLNIPAGVALRKESVDRNNFGRLHHNISIVALRKESVDRNLCDRTVHQVNQVALRKESVDRNWYSSRIIISVLGRSPQGERG